MFFIRNQEGKRKIEITGRKEKIGITGKEIMRKERYIHIVTKSLYTGVTGTTGSPIYGGTVHQSNRATMLLKGAISDPFNAIHSII